MEVKLTNEVKVVFMRMEFLDVPSKKRGGGQTRLKWKSNTERSWWDKILRWDKCGNGV